MKKNNIHSEDYRFIQSDDYRTASVKNNGKAMKIRKLSIVIGVLMVVLVGCNKKWDDHYNLYPDTVNQNLWEAMQNDPNISNFVQVMKDHKLDTLFNSDIVYSVFAPTNDALAAFSSPFDTTILKYHISSHFVHKGSIPEKRKVQTLTRKFALFEKMGSDVRIDEIPVVDESPLYLNGRYFTMEQVVVPKPNLYEYFKVTNDVLSTYIDKQDTIIIDPERSKPLGFDDKGNTIYDTVAIIANKFESKYFPVKHEFRNATSTIVFPLEEDYNKALDVMAESLGGNYVDHTDIPVEWQEEILIPHLLKQGVFLNMIEQEEFIWSSERDTVKLLNVLGDSVVITYVPVDKALCSNGYAYNYMDFEIPDSLYQGGTRLETEKLVRQTGLNKFSWRDSVKVVSSSPFNPLREYVPTASNDSIIRVQFPKGYTGTYSVDFKGPSLFPRKYLMIVRTHMDVGGLFDIYINDELAGTIDYYNYVRFRGLWFGVNGDRYIPEGRFNRWDVLVNNLTEYGRIRIRIEYKGPSTFILGNGLVMDYIEFVPID